jgi:membrane associated rhomboid family serine protease
MEKANIRFYSLWLSALIVLVFILQLIFSGFTDFFMLTENALKMPWQFLTAVFLHGSLTHLLYNLFALVLFGLILESVIGSKRFFWLFMISGIGANLISFFWYPNALGASGAIMAIIGCLAVLRPMMIVWAFNLPMPMFVLAIIWVVGSILGIFGLGDPGTGHLAHLSGLFLGLLYGFFLRIRHSQSKPGFSQTQRIIIQEGAMRKWEDSNLR